MILKQYYLGCLAHASYLVADEESKTRRSSIRSATSTSTSRTPSATGSPIRYVFLTHFHADFVAGHLELRDRVGADDLPRRAGGGGVRRSRRSPTATRSSSARRSASRCSRRRATRPSRSRSSSTTAEHGEQPYAVLTGDTLFIGDVGRPDLRASLGWSAEELGSDALRLAARAAAAAARRDARLPGARRGLAVRQEPEHRHGLDDRRAAAVQLRAAADERRTSSSASSRPTSRTRRPTSRTTRSSTRRSAPTLEATLERELQPLALDEVHHAERSRAAPAARHARPGRVRGRARPRRGQRRPRRRATRPGAGRCSTPRGRS